MHDYRNGTVSVPLATLPAELALRMPVTKILIIKLLMLFEV